MTKIGGLGKRSLLALIAMIVLASGCSAAKKTGEWLGFESKSAAKEKGVFYAGADGLVVRDAPKSSGKVVGTLSLHQKVVRSKVTDGYALVRAAGGGIPDADGRLRLLRRRLRVGGHLGLVGAAAVGPGVGFRRATEGERHRFASERL